MADIRRKAGFADQMPLSDAEARRGWVVGYGFHDLTPYLNSPGSDGLLSRDDVLHPERHDRER